MRRALLLTCWLAPAAVAVQPPPADPVVRVPAAPLPADEETRRDALTRYGIGLIQDRKELPTQAVKQFQSAADSDPTAAAPHRELARLYAELGRDPAAIRAARKAVALNPDDFETGRLLGRLLTDARQYADATAALRRAADSATLTDPVVKLAILKELSKAADAATDNKTGEAARRDALKVIAGSKANLLQPNLFTATELDRERAKLYEGLGTVLVNRKEFAAASASFQTARDLSSDPKGANDPAGVARLHWHLSGSLLAQGEPAAALKELEKYLEFKPAAFEPYERLVELYRKLNRADELPATLAGLAEDNRKNPAPRWLAAATSFAREPEVADALFRKLVNTLKTADEARVLVAAYREAGRPKEFLELLDKAYKAARPVGYDDDDKQKSDKPPDPPPADAVERARLLTAAVKQVPPKVGFTKALVRQVTADVRAGTPPGSDVFELVSGLATRDGQSAAYLDGLMTGVGDRAGNKRAWGVLFGLLREQRRWSDLIALAERARNTEAFRRNLGPVYSVALAYAELGREKDALANVQYVIDNVVADGRLSAKVQKARLLNILDKPDAALKQLAEVAEEFKAPADQRQIAVVRADSLNLLKKYAEAEAVLRQLLDDDPDDVLVLNNLGYHLADQGRKLEEAETFIRRAIELDKFERVKRGDPEPVSGGYTDSLGWALFRRGKLTEAREHLEAAVASPESAPDAIVWDHLGDVAFRQGDTKRAAAAWKKAVELFADGHLGRQNGRLDEAKRKLKLAE